MAYGVRGAKSYDEDPNAAAQNAQTDAQYDLNKIREMFAKDRAYLVAKPNDAGMKNMNSLTRSGHP